MARKLSLGLQLGYWGAHAPTDHVELAQEAGLAGLRFSVDRRILWRQ